MHRVPARVVVNHELLSALILCVQMISPEVKLDEHYLDSLDGIVLVVPYINVRLMLNSGPTTVVLTEVFVYRHHTVEICS